MIRATTPTFKLTIGGDVDLTVADKIVVSISQVNTHLELTGDALEVSTNSISCWVTQEQSLRLLPAEAKLQVNWTYIDEHGNVKRAATNIATITIGDNLLKRVL